MADLLSNKDKVSFQGSVLDLFDTFSRSIVIHKEPIKKITQVNVNLLPGYGNSSAPTNIEYIPRSQSFRAIIDYKGKQSVSLENDAGILVPKGGISIKVKEETKNYINDGKTEKIIIDDKTFKLASNDTVRDYFGMKMYIYFLEEVS